MGATMPERDLEVLRWMTPEQKLRALDTLRQSAWVLVEAGVRSRQPRFTEDEVRAETRRIMTDDAS